MTILSFSLAYAVHQSQCQLSGKVPPTNGNEQMITWTKIIYWKIYLKVTIYYCVSYTENENKEHTTYYCRKQNANGMVLSYLVIQKCCHQEFKHCPITSRLGRYFVEMLQESLVSQHCLSVLFIIQKLRWWLKADLHPTAIWYSLMVSMSIIHHQSSFVQIFFHWNHWTGHFSIFYSDYIQRALLITIKIEC